MVLLGKFFQQLAVKQNFIKAERLSSKKIIDQLFEKGREKTNSVFLYPFRVVYLLQTTSENIPNSILITVSKRFFKKAVDRNQIKRRIREAYRLNKNIFKSTETENVTAQIAFVYIGKEIVPFSLIQSKMIVILQEIEQKKQEKRIHS
jgi:ribonuclease P protein component